MTKALFHSFLNVNNANKTFNCVLIRKNKILKKTAIKHGAIQVLIQQYESLSIVR